jgi:hypothetical protein
MLSSDPGFESSGTYANITRVSWDCTTIHSGSYCGKQAYTAWNVSPFTGNFSGSFAYSNNPLTGNDIIPGKQYRLSVWNKNTVESGDVYIGMEFKNSSGTVIDYVWQKIPNQNTSPSWQICEMNFIPPAETAQINPYFCIDSNVLADPSSGALPDVYWDDIVIEPCNLAYNPGYETALTYTPNASRTSENPHSGNYCITQTYTPGGAPDEWDCVYTYDSAKFIACTAGEQYYFSAWNKNTVASGDIKIGMRFINSSGNSISYSWGQPVQTNFTDWQKREMTFTAPSGAVKMTPYFKVENNVTSGDIYWDDITVSRIPANLAIDPGFEQSPTNYVGATLDSANQRSGIYCGKQTYASGNAWNCMYSNMPYIRCGGNESFCLSVWNKNNVPASGSGNPDDRICIGVRFIGSAGGSIEGESIGYTAWQPVPHNSSAWQQSTLEFTTPPGTVAINPYFMIGKNIANGYNIYWDDITVTPSAVHASDYGSAHNAATINAAIQAIGSAERTLLLDGASWAIDNDVTVPSNIILKIAEETLLNITATYDLIIQGKVKIPSTKKFTGLGNVAFQDATVAAMPQWWGAVANNNIDCAPAIRSALASGATNVYLPRGTYLIKTLSGTQLELQEYAFVIPSGMTVYGDGMKATSIRMDDGILINSPASLGGGGFMVNNKQNVNLKSFKIDMNGYNNLVPPTPVKACYALIAMSSNHVTAEGVGFFDTAGRNDIVFYFGDHNTVKSCMVRNGGTSLTGNANQNDFSAIYIYSTNTTVENNSICHDNFPVNAGYLGRGCGGVEMHASEIKCENNWIEKSLPAAYVVSHHADEINTGAAFRYNIASQCVGGVSLSAMEGPGVIDNMEIENNRFSLKKALRDPESLPNTFGSYAIFMDDGYDGIYTSLVTNATITGNVMDDLDSPVPSDPRSHFIYMNGCQTATISNNTVNKTSGSAIVIVGNPNDLKDVTISGNTISDFGANSGTGDTYAIQFSLTGSSVTPQQDNFNLDNVQIINNAISRTPASTVGAFYFNWNDGSEILNLLVQGNTLTTGLQVKAGPKSNLVNVLP